MWEPQNRWGRELDRWLSLLNDKRLWNGVRSLFAYADGPNVHVHDEGDFVRVLIRPPVFPPGADWRWAVRPTGSHLMVRGTFPASAGADVSRSGLAADDDRFVRVVPLPCPVRRRPTQVRYEGELLSLRFDKRTKRSEDGWYRVPPRRV